VSLITLHCLCTCSAVAPMRRSPIPFPVSSDSRPRPQVEAAGVLPTRELALSLAPIAVDESRTCSMSRLPSPLQLARRPMHRQAPRTASDFTSSPSGRRQEKRRALTERPARFESHPPAKARTCSSAKGSPPASLPPPPMSGPCPRPSSRWRHHPAAPPVRSVRLASHLPIHSPPQSMLS
jgi:hypothetical protein